MENSGSLSSSETKSISQRDSFVSPPVEAHAIPRRPGISVSPKNLCEKAFLGRSIFMQDCADACDFLKDAAPLIREKKRPTLCTYFIGPEHGPIKIGSARDPWLRLWTLQTGYPEELFLWAFADIKDFGERDLHQEFSEDRLRGEWFTRSERILRRIILIQERFAVSYEALRQGHPA